MRALKEKNTPTAMLSGFTLMEVIVGLIIMSIVFGGLIATFVGVKRYVSRATRRVVSTSLDRQVLNSLYREVRADTWDTGALSSSVAGVTHNSAAAGLGSPLNIDGFVYGAGGNPNVYIVENVTNRDYRRVRVTVSYPTN
ncbi:MAG: type II secretion system protein [Candidatus Omnitrophota bacterium]|jgi:prepilin-type N-terminal cleavage/methylation domain-containing protein